MNMLLSPRRVQGKPKRMLGHSSSQYHNRYSTDFKFTKIEAGNLPQTGLKVSSVSEVGGNGVVQSATSRVIELNNLTSEHRMPPMTNGKAKVPQQRLVKKNMEAVCNEANSTKMTAGKAFLASSKSETSSCLVPCASSYSISNNRGVFVSREFPHGLERLDLPPGTSEVLTDKVSQLTRSLDGTLQIGDIQDFSSIGERMGKKDSTGIAVGDQNKLKQVDIDGTCKIAHRKTSPECRWKSTVEEELYCSSQKGQIGHRAETFSEKMSLCERVSCSSRSTIEACAMAKHQGEIVPEPTKAHQAMKKSASILDSAGSGVPNLDVALDVACSPRSTNSSPIHSHECRQVSSREKVHKVLKQFKELFTQLLEEWRSISVRDRKGCYRADLKAANILRENGKWINCGPCIGDVPGVHIGDRFQYRAELAIIGLHREYMCGIHCEKIEGKSYATSIVDSGRYDNKTITADEFIYIGEGGNPEISSGLKDQTLNGGNLALKNSMDSGIPVRVIRGVQTLTTCNTMGINKRSGFTFVYDGLYQVNDCKYCHDPNSGNKVFEFRMKRMTGDPNLTRHTYSVPKTSTIYRKQEMIDDMGGQKEKMLSSVVKNVRASKFIYGSMSNAFGGSRYRLQNKDEIFDYEAGAPMAKPLIPNHRPNAKGANKKLKLG